MHHSAAFIQDLAVIMVFACAVTLLFYRLKQPVVLGYIIAGVIIGPHTPPFNLIADEQTIGTLAELGVVFLLFSLGLEFNIKKLFLVGASALVAAIVEILVMLWIGFEIGRAFRWGPMDSLFLGAMIAISSTTIIVKALQDLKLKREKFAQLIFGILIVEDILAIAIIALLSSVASSGSVNSGEVMITLSKLGLFMTISLIVGMLLVPRLLQYVSRTGSQELLLITVLGLCFGFGLLVIKFNYSVALGAFLIGAIIAESRQVHSIESLIQPLRDMFSAIFFVAIGLMLDPHIIGDYWLPIIIISLFVMIGKILSCSISTFICGQDGKTSLKVGMGLAQIGEFSFIIAALGLSLKVTSDFLYPIAVAVSSVTTLTTPYFIKAADPTTEQLAQIMPPSLQRLSFAYTNWVQSIGTHGEATILFNLVRRILLQVAVNLAIVSAIFLALAFFTSSIENFIPDWTTRRARDAILWGIALLLAMPFLVAVYRKIKSLSLLLAELSVHVNVAGRFAIPIRRVLAEIIPLIAMIGIFLLMVALSGRFLPATDLLVVVLLTAAIILGFTWPWLVRLHAKLQIALHETMEKEIEE